MPELTDTTTPIPPCPLGRLEIARTQSLRQVQKHVGIACCRQAALLHISIVYRAASAMESVNRITDIDLRLLTRDGGSPSTGVRCDKQ